MKQTTFAETLDAADILSEKGISARVIDMAIVKPLDKSAMLSTAKDCGKIVTCEEHSISVAWARRSVPLSRSMGLPAR